MSIPRKYLIGGNWKLNGSIQKVDELASLVSGTDKVDVVIAPPYPYLAYARSKFPSSVAIASQNITNYKAGAYTGEVSASMVKELGCEWTILGHSERRTLFDESDQLIASKLSVALEAGLNVILCIGESLDVREQNNTKTFVLSQLEAQLEALKSIPEAWARVAIAYEPIWAIGTGKVASPDQAEEVHHWIQEWAIKNVHADAQFKILYGGSVNSKNCASLITQPDIHGFLVGGASLTGEFADIIKTASQ